MKIPRLSVASLPLTGGLDEISASNKLKPEDCLEMENFRISKDGQRIEKRLGYSNEVIDFGEDVYGYTTYTNSDEAHCQLAILESQIKRKVGDDAWASVHTFSSNISHPVKPVEIQGKQLIINETDSRMIHHDGNDYQIGITAPTTLPTVESDYVTPSVDLPLDDDMDYADQSAMDAVWTDGDSGSDAYSVLSASDPGGNEGPSGNSKYMRFYSTAPATGTYARRYLTAGDIGQKYTLEFASYLVQGGYYPWQGDIWVDVSNGLARFRLVIVNYGILYWDGSNYQEIQRRKMTGYWQKYKISVDTSNANNSTFTITMNGSDLGTWSFSDPTTSNAGLVDIRARTGHVDHGDPDIYFDNITIGGTGDDAGEGKLGDTDISIYRYAVTYARSGNYGAESNPIKSVIDAVTFDGTGLNDMTVDSDSEYTGAEDKNIIVEIDGTGTTDTIKISYDEGVTWSTTGFNLSSSIYLHYGITVDFGATTGHTLGDSWTIPCRACSVTAAGEKVTLTSIPTSTDAQVDQRKIYRTVAGGARFYFLATINDNTTTTFVDNYADMELGELMEEDHDILPNGKFSAWWDDRLWVSGEDILYYSRIWEPEHFDETNRYVTINKGDFSDDIMGIIPYKDSLYVFRRNSIFAVQKTSSGYGVYLVNSDVGCLASWSLIEVNNLLFFISQRGVEAYNGVEPYPIETSLFIDRTIRTIDSSNYDYITAIHNKQYRELWISVPDRTGGNSAITLVYNYLKGKWYYFSFAKIPSCLALCVNSSGQVVNKIGTRDGFLLLADTGYRDGDTEGNTTNITCTYKKGWISSDLYADVVRLEAEYEIPNGMTITANVYVNFETAVRRTDSLTGVDLTSADIELRRPIFDFSELGQRAKYFTVEFTNNENLGGNLKINDVKVFYKPRYTMGKTHGTINEE